MSTYKKKNISISKYKIEGQDINTTISDNIIYYDIENKGLLNLIKISSNLSKKSSSKSSKRLSSNRLSSKRLSSKSSKRSSSKK